MEVKNFFAAASFFCRGGATFFPFPFAGDGAWREMASFFNEGAGSGTGTAAGTSRAGFSLRRFFDFIVFAAWGSSALIIAVAAGAPGFAGIWPGRADASFWAMITGSVTAPSG